MEGADLQGTFDFADWPLYIDHQGRLTDARRLQRQARGHRQLQPVIQDNASFFSQISPVLQAGQSTGYDMVVISDGWELTQMIKNHWLIPLDHSRCRTSALRGPLGPTHLRPRQRFTVAWQSGITGIAYDPRKTGRDITTVKDLFDPAFAGKVGMMADDTELASAGMLALGIEPSTSTPADWRKAADLLRKQRDDGIVRQYYDQSYIKALQQGDTYISMAWSGDVFQAQISGNSNLKFVVPDEGGMFWHDNCMIPSTQRIPSTPSYGSTTSTGPSPGAITDWVNYVSPVPAAQPIVAGKLDDPTVADSPLVFPTPAIDKQLVAYYDFKGVDDHEEWTSIFDPIIQS